MVAAPEVRGTVPFMRIDVLMADRPVWRGLMHAWAFVLAIPGGVALIVFADRPAARVAAAVYAATLLLVFGTSAAYHRLAQSYEARRIMQRIDHMMIYLLITGTYVPICIVALPPSWGIPLLVVVGAAGCSASS
jgi:hemolysin III